MWNKRYNCPLLIEIFCINYCFSKGPTFLSKLLRLPEQILIDYMHASLEGTLKKMLNLWFNSKYHKKPFYLKNVVDIDSVLMKIQFPSEFPRSQRSLEYFHFFKANELRNLIFYSIIYILKEKMHKKYFDHLVLFILFVRTLTKNKLNDNDIKLCEFYIEKFVEDFQNLYGIENMTHNLHSHLHLPSQCFNFGPLNKTSCFAFEGLY